MPEEDIESPGAGPPDDFKTWVVLKDTHDMGAESGCCETICENSECSQLLSHFPTPKDQSFCAWLAGGGGGGACDVEHSRLLT